MASLVQARADHGVTVSSEEQHDAVCRLIAIGSEKGYLLREEIDAHLPVDVASGACVDRC